MLEEWFEAAIEVIPAVDVLGEGAVRLHQGAYDEVVVRAGDPVELARAFAEAGARRIHLVDLDGARTGRVRPERAGGAPGLGRDPEPRRRTRVARGGRGTRRRRHGGLPRPGAVDRARRAARG